jgi:hypothetical protein
MIGYNAFDKGHLPNAGALGNQPLMFMPIVSLVSSSFSDELEYERVVERQNKTTADQSQLTGDGPGFARLTR